jgi:hypothetical protein
MKGLLYLYRKTVINAIRRALKKPATYVVIVIIVAYVKMMLWSFADIIEEGSLASASNYAVILCLCVFVNLPSNILSYSRKKGLLFRQSDVHFVFPAPISPKLMLFMVNLKNVGLTFLATFVLTLGGIFLFHVPAGVMILYFLLAGVFEIIFESALVVLIYGNERIGRFWINLIRIVVLATIGAMIAGFLYLAYTQGGIHMNVFRDYFAMPFIRLVPIIGWNIAFVQLLLVGVNTSAVVGTALFLAVGLLLLFVAWKMPCVGEYYEDAMRFADDYVEAKKRSGRGEVTFVGQKKSYKRASVRYKGSYAKAIFYRQLLEYKKQRTFIFGFMTLVNLIIAVALCFIFRLPDLQAELFTEDADLVNYIIPGVMLYVWLIFSGVTPKWEAELRNPYTFLIPDTSFHKLFESTKMEALKAFVDGCIFVILPSLMIGSPFYLMLAQILMYVSLQMDKVYLTMMIRAVFGAKLGNVGQVFCRLFFELVLLTMFAAVMALGAVFVSAFAGVLFVSVFAIAVAIVGMAVCTTCFQRMEMSE